MDFDHKLGDNTPLFLVSLSPLSLPQRVVAGKWKSKIDLAIKMGKKGVNEEDLIEEARIMK